MLARETGWKERFIVWELPLSRALGYYHAALRAEGAWTVAPAKITPIRMVIPPGFFDSGEDE